MAKVSSTEPPFIKQLAKALIAGLDNAGIEAEIETEPVRLTKLYRVIVVAWGFKHLRPSERQDLAWRIASNTLTPEQQLLIGMILTLTPDEMDIRWSDDEKVRQEIKRLRGAIKYLKAHAGKTLDNVELPSAPFEWSKEKLKPAQIPRAELKCRNILQDFQRAHRFLQPERVS